MENTNPAEYYRKIIRDAHYKAPMTDHDPAKDSKIFQEFVSEYYESSRARLEALTHAGSPEPETEVARNGFFALALASATYGNVYAALELLKGIPFLPLNAARVSAGALMGLLPLPEDLNPRKQYNETMEWFRINLLSLRWDMEKNRFVLEA